MSTYYVVILGSESVGKTSLIISFLEKKFSEEYDPTIENNYQLKLNLDEEKIILEVIDTAGQEEYSPMRETYYRSGEGFILVYSINNR